MFTRSLAKIGSAHNGQHREYVHRALVRVFRSDLVDNVAEREQGFSLGSCSILDARTLFAVVLLSLVVTSIRRNDLLLRLRCFSPIGLRHVVTGRPLSSCPPHVDSAKVFTYFSSRF